MVSPAGRAEIAVGSTRITYLPDGHGRLDPGVLFPASRPDGWATHAAYLDEDGWFPVSIGSFLIRTADRVVLVDLGLGEVEFAVPDVASFRGGRLLDSLAGEGVAPEDVDTVFFTHLHHDHVGWTSDIAPSPHAEAPQRDATLTPACGSWRLPATRQGTAASSSPTPTGAAAAGWSSSAT